MGVIERIKSSHTHGRSEACCMFDSLCESDLCAECETMWTVTAHTLMEALKCMHSDKLHKHTHTALLDKVCVFTKA